MTVTYSSQPTQACRRKAEFHSAQQVGGVEFGIWFVFTVFTGTQLQNWKMIINGKRATVNV